MNKDIRWYSVEEKQPEEGEYVWIYMPWYPEKWRFVQKDVLTSHYEQGLFVGIGKENSPYVKAWHPWVEAFAANCPKYIAPNCHRCEKESNERTGTDTPQPV